MSQFPLVPATPTAREDLSSLFADEITWWVESTTGWHTPTPSALVDTLVEAVTGTATDTPEPTVSLTGVVVRVLAEAALPAPHQVLAERLASQARRVVTDHA